MNQKPTQRKKKKKQQKTKTVIFQYSLFLTGLALQKLFLYLKCKVYLYAALAEVILLYFGPLFNRKDIECTVIEITFISFYKSYYSIELTTRQLPCSQRSVIFGHLAWFLPCTKDTLLKRAKKLRLDRQEDQLKGPLQKLKDGN